MSILVCGGAGYIGSHAVHQLVELNVVRAEDLRDDVAVEVAEVEG